MVIRRKIYLKKKKKDWNKSIGLVFAVGFFAYVCAYIS